MFASCGSYYVEKMLLVYSLGLTEDLLAASLQNLLRASEQNGQLEL